MNEFSSVDRLRGLFAEIAKDKFEGLEVDGLRIEHGEDLLLELKKYGSLLSDSIRRLEESGVDELAVQSALIHVRIHAMSLCSFFDDIAEDAERLLIEAKWPDIPEDYVTPS
ncbi:hypothetical protein [Pseudomonas entomophila]|uniref:hypothetical protein n=1 Tax=Pseudomonas entomophila TaxID=312306 RepID=UPI001EFFE2DC|nr:hypothetical protein [Pseudomonas entomophila]MCG8294009.1 hypothetical protein [Pseudomonas entomophila]